MKTLDELWAEFSAGKEDTLATCAKDLLHWKNTASLCEGRFREFSRLLRKEGYPDYQCLGLAENTVSYQALLAAERTWFKEMLGEEQYLLKEPINIDYTQEPEDFPVNSMITEKSTVEVNYKEKK